MSKLLVPRSVIRQYLLPLKTDHPRVALVMGALRGSYVQ